MPNNPRPADSPPDALRVRDFYLGRQPILDRQNALFGYELLFRNAATGPAQFDTDLTATASVIGEHTFFLDEDDPLRDGFEL